MVVKPGYKPKNIKAYLLLNEKNEYIGIDPVNDERIVVPDIGTLAQGKSKCNVLTEKASIVLMLDDKDNTILKHGFFKEALLDGSQYEPLFKICYDFLNSEKELEKARNDFLQSKYKDGDIIGFKIGSFPIEQSDKYDGWWQEFYRKQREEGGKGKSVKRRCFITGELAESVDTVPKISGLKNVGGHSSGDSFICFDKDAYCSYGLKQAHNAAVSEESVTIVNKVLYELINRAPTLVGAKFVHWYKEPIPDRFDLCKILSDDFWGDGNDTEVEPQDQYFQEPLALQEADKLLNSIDKGEYPTLLNNVYYIMVLSGASGRVMLRNYMQGSYLDLYYSFKAWFDDLRIVTPSGKGLSKAPKIYALILRLFGKRMNRKEISQHMKDIAGLQSHILLAIIQNKPLPDAVASRALQYLKSELHIGDESNKTIHIGLDMLSCQLLKIWLIRKQKDKGVEVTVKEDLNKDSGSVAYHAGRMMAVFAAIQIEALGDDLGAGVLQRYYTAASTTPALVIGKLSSLSQYHLSKIEKKAFANRYLNLLSEIASKIGSKLPTTFMLEEQSQFALGYYQQRANLYKKNNEKKEEE